LDSLLLELGRSPEKMIKMNFNDRLPLRIDDPIGRSMPARK